jgi:transposase-like protein
MVRRVLSEGRPPKAVARAFGVETKTVNKWVMGAAPVAGLAVR